MYKFLLLICLYLPFQLALNPAAGVDLASIRILILILFFVWLAEGLKEKRLVIKNNWQTWLVASFLFINAFSIITSRNTDWSLRKLMFLFSIFPLYFVASEVISSKEKAIGVIKTLVLSGFLVALIGVVQFGAQFVLGLETVYSIWAKFIIIPFLGESFGEAVLKNPSWLVNIGGETYLRATSLFPDPHMFSFYLGLLMPLSLGIYLENKEKRAWNGVFFGIIFLADLLTFSRGGYLGIVAGLLFVGFMFWLRIEKKHKIMVGALAFLGAMIMLVPSPVSQRLFSSFDLKEGSNQGRLAMWEKAADVTVSKPILGTGIGNYPLEVLPTAGYREPIYAHNTYLDISAETGILNAFVWIGLLGVTFAIFWKKSKKERIFFFASVSLIVFAVHSITETAIYSPVVLSLFLVILSFSNIELENGKNI